MTTPDDPGSLSLAELRELRNTLQRDDDAVSFVRRMTQARLDLVHGEQRRRAEGAGHSSSEITGELAGVLSEHLTGGGASRPPRPAEDFSDHPLARQLDEMCNEVGGDPSQLSDSELEQFAAQLLAFERARSDERRELFARIDALSAELVRRYREGEADVDGLLVED
jgi:hypothetical protein